MSDINNVGKGLLLFLATGAALMLLKIGRVISWSWIWVTIPFWGPFALLILIAILLIIIKLFSKLLGWVARIK